MKKLLILVFVSVFFGQLSAQTDEFSRLMEKGESYLNEREYIEAFVYFMKAKEKAISRADDSTATARLENCRFLISRQNIELALSLEETERARFETDVALGLARSIVNAFYFYDEKLALAFKNNKYGFIDKSGETVIGYKYEEAYPFDNLGMAKVRRGGKYYLIDTNGTEYLLADGLSNLRRETQALDLRNKQLVEFPPSVGQTQFQFPRLNILLLNSNEIRIFPPNILNLSNLNVISLSNNKLRSVPFGLSLITGLRILDLSNNLLLMFRTRINSFDAKWLVI